MLSDEDIAKIRRYADRYHEVPACFVADTLDEITRLRAENDRLRARMPSYGDVEAIRRCVHGVASGDDMVWAVAWLARQEDENAD